MTDLRKMKRTLYALIMIAAAFTACQKELELAPAVSFFNASPEIHEETAIFRLAYANITDSTERVFPVTFGGTAVKGTDYIASGDRFVFGGENPIDSIVVTTLQLGTDRTLDLTVSLPENYSSGKYITSGYTLQDKLAYFSFAKGYQMLCDSLDISFNAMDRSGKAKALGSDTEIYLTINQEKTTAVEGIDFEFSDSSRLTLLKGAKSGSLELKSLNPNPQHGRDKVVLNIGFGDKFSGGEVTEMEISLLDTLWKHLDGAWMADSLVTDLSYMEGYWKDTCTGLDLLPEYNKNDKLTFNLENTRLTTSMRSDFKNYFSSQSDLRKGNSLCLDLGNGTTADLQTFWLDNTNRYFSSEHQSEDKESLIGLRFFPENTDSLDLYIIDYVSKSFMPELESTGQYAPEKPVAASPGLFFNLTFTRQ